MKKQTSKGIELLCDGSKNKNLKPILNRCCPGECIAGPGSPITRSNKIK